MSLETKTDLSAGNRIGTLLPPDSPFPGVLRGVDPGEFWIGFSPPVCENEKEVLDENGKVESFEFPRPDSKQLRVATRTQLPYEPGIFVGFRRKGRPQLNLWWWEVVYAKSDGDRLSLHAYNYNLFVMPLTSLKRSSWQVRQTDILWIAELKDATDEERYEYVKNAWKKWTGSYAPYDMHRFARNGLRTWVNLLPYRF